MSRFRVVVVDDEPLARQVAVELVRRDPEVEAVDECGDGEQAQELIARTRPDIVFLDIEMPGRDGIRLAESFGTGAPVVVFTTAFARYAVDAFGVAATDYVLKPFSDERLLEALARAKRRVRERRLGELAHQMAHVAGELQADEPKDGPDPPRYLERLSLKHGDGSVVLKTEDIVWIEAEDYCVRIHSTRGRHLIRASLSALEGRLDPATFVRAHRTAIVNLAQIRETSERDGFELVLADGSRVGVSRSRRARVEALLSPRLR